MFNLIRNQGNAFSDHNKRHFRWVNFKNPTLPNVVTDVKQQELGVLTGSTTLKNNFELLAKNVFTLRPSNPTPRELLLIVHKEIRARKFIAALFATVNHWK